MFDPDDSDPHKLMIKLRLAAARTRAEMPADIEARGREYLESRVRGRADAITVVERSLEVARTDWRSLPADDRPPSLDELEELFNRALVAVLPTRAQDLSTLKQIAQDAMRTDIVFPYVHFKVGGLSYRRTAERTWARKSALQQRITRSLEQLIKALDPEAEEVTKQQLNDSLVLMRTLFRKSELELDVRDLVVGVVLEAMRDAGGKNPIKDSPEFHQLIQVGFRRCLDSLEARFAVSRTAGADARGWAEEIEKFDGAVAAALEVAAGRGVWAREPSPRERVHLAVGAVVNAIKHSCRRIFDVLCEVARVRPRSGMSAEEDIDD